METLCDTTFNHLTSELYNGQNKNVFAISIELVRVCEFNVIKFDDRKMWFLLLCRAWSGKKNLRVIPCSVEICFGWAIAQVVQGKGTIRFIVAARNVWVIFRCINVICHDILRNFCLFIFILTSLAPASVLSLFTLLVWVFQLKVRCVLIMLGQKSPQALNSFSIDTCNAFRFHNRPRWAEAKSKRKGKDCLSWFSLHSVLIQVEFH